MSYIVIASLSARFLWDWHTLCSYIHWIVESVRKGKKLPPGQARTAAAIRVGLIDRFRV